MGLWHDGNAPKFGQAKLKLRREDTAENNSDPAFF